jgi:uncharacterized repeat protein (TIGR03803 family)
LATIRRTNVITKIKATLTATVIFATLSLAQAQVYTIVATFDGDGPDMSPLARDTVGNLYGVGGYTAILKIDPTGKVTTLYNLKGAPDGWWPVQVVRDPEENLYGTTEYGGTGTCSYGPFAGCGTVFKLTATGEETVLHSFTDSPDGAWPYAGPVRDNKGNLYGTTFFGGSATGTCFSSGCGTVYKIDPAGKETVLHSFHDQADGALPQGDLLLADGALYGTTAAGGTGPCEHPYNGCGTVFKLVGKKETVLYNFQGLPDGQVPEANVVRDAAGNLYGTTQYGGDANCNSPFGCGIVFKLDPTGKETILHTFKGQNIPPSPGGVVIDPEGNVYGSAYGSGDSFGYVFKISSSGQFSVFYSFTYGDFGAPADLILDGQGNLYGSDGGAVYRLTP